MSEAQREAYDASITIRVSGGFKGAIKRGAQRAGRKLSDYARILLREGMNARARFTVDGVPVDEFVAQMKEARSKDD